ncbi:MAG: hypothetical protein JWM80_4903, partial [Cyanobacteria bacterium RYN_339]|nr:hypothetical protein [Cyanobacteria bacterium RYN_339]
MRHLVRTIALFGLLGGCAVATPSMPTASPSTLPTAATTAGNPTPQLRPAVPVNGAVTTIAAANIGTAVDLAMDVQDNLYIAALDGIYVRSPDGIARRLAEVRNAAAFRDVDPT